MVVVDHFLNNFVFPRHAKQFAQKLVSSGWDLPLLPANGSGEDHFLNNFVFPRHAKQFAQKLVSSGWDLPLLPANGSGEVGSRQKENVRPTNSKTVMRLADGAQSSLTTGFSGTNDNRTLLKPSSSLQQHLRIYSYSTMDTAVQQLLYKIHSHLANTPSFFGAFLNSYSSVLRQRSTSLLRQPLHGLLHNTVLLIAKLTLDF